MKNSLLWAIFAGALLVLTVLMYGMLNILIPSSWALGLSLIMFAAVMAASIFNGWTVVKENHEYIVEILGKYIGKPLEPGLYILFPWFNLVSLRCDVLKAQQLMELYLDEAIKDGFGGGKVDFEDNTSRVTAFLYFSFVDSRLATYSSDNVFRFIEEKADSLLRSFFGQYKLKEANAMKNNFTLAAMAGSVDFCPTIPLTPAEIAALKKDAEDNFKSTDFYLSLMSYGVEPIDLVMSDIVLDPKTIEERNKILVAEIEIEVARKKLEQTEIDNQVLISVAEAKKVAAILEAEGEKQGQILKGSGQANQVKKLIKAGIPEEQAASLLINYWKWKALENGKNNVTLIEGSNEASKGANFGAGFGTNKV